jgi:hypothetical protein
VERRGTREQVARDLAVPTRLDRSQERREEHFGLVYAPERDVCVTADADRQEVMRASSRPVLDLSTHPPPPREMLMGAEHLSVAEVRRELALLGEHLKRRVIDGSVEARIVKPQT